MSDMPTKVDLKKINIGDWLLIGWQDESPSIGLVIELDGVPVVNAAGITVLLWDQRDVRDIDTPEQLLAHFSSQPPPEALLRLQEELSGVRVPA